VWLELEQRDGDLAKAVALAASDKGLLPIPEPHCTVLYGVSHMSEDEVKECFRNKVVPLLKDGWPVLSAKGPYSGISYDGVDGHEMDMSWIELSLHTSDAHEAMVDTVHSCFYNGDYSSKARSGPWTPHVSIAYDDPKDTVLNKDYADKIFQTFPTLMSQLSREVVAISLWRNEGMLWDWECLDRFSLPKSKN
jgi:hypothetical protein